MIVWFKTEERTVLMLSLTWSLENSDQNLSFKSASQMLNVTLKLRSIPGN